ncbi:MAG: MFS transporter [Nitrososphaeria archaeon]
MRGDLHGLAALSVFLSMFLWGFADAIAPLATQWPMVPEGAYVYMLLAVPVGLVSGNLAMGHLADRVGRKPVMVAALAIYAAGAALVALAGSWAPLALGIALLEFSVAGGDEPAMLSYLAESSPARSRGSLIMLASNGANVGAAAAAAISMLAGGGFEEQRLALAATLALALPLALAVRAGLPESAAWLRARESGAGASLRRALGGAAKAYFLVTIALTTILTYGLVSWALAPYFYPGMVPQIILEFNAGAVAGGLLGYAIVDRQDRRSASLQYYAGGFLSGLAIVAQLALLPSALWAFVPLLMINGAFTQLTWGLRLVMEPELFPTGLRATSIAIIRTSGWIAYVASLFLTGGFTVVSFMAYDLALWALGVSGAAVWAAAGYETRGRAIEELDFRASPRRSPRPWRASRPGPSASGASR